MEFYLVEYNNYYLQCRTTISIFTCITAVLCGKACNNFLLFSSFCLCDCVLAFFVIFCILLFVVLQVSVLLLHIQLN